MADESDSGGPAGWDRIGQLLYLLQRYIRLYCLMAFLAVLVSFVLYVQAEPVYTAVAVIGPPNPSPITSLMGSLTGSGSATAGLTRRILGGSGAGGANDPFQEYLQLLNSTRLAQTVAEKDKILPIIFYKRWDAQAHDWKPHSQFHEAANWVRGLLHIPIKDHPDFMDFKGYLNENFSVADANARRSTLLSAASGYMMVTFSFADRAMAETILDKLLLRADDIIRQEQSRDVLARISYLQSELPSITQTDQKAAIIDALSGQEELKMMLMADHRYASTLVDQPFASMTPTSPASPSRTLLMAFVLSGMAWVALVLLSLRSPRLSRMMAPFDSRKGR